MIDFLIFKGLYYTGNVSAEIAAEWVFENIDHPELNDPFQVCHIPLFNLNPISCILCSYVAYTLKSLTSCNKSANKLSTRCIRTACHKLSTGLEQLVDNL